MKHKAFTAVIALTMGSLVMAKTMGTPLSTEATRAILGIHASMGIAIDQACSMPNNEIQCNALKIGEHRRIQRMTDIDYAAQKAHGEVVEDCQEEYSTEAYQGFCNRTDHKGCDTDAAFEAWSTKGQAACLKAGGAE